ncbi:hypothetical protein HYPSUDRAFT_81192 [Hypholoma sublateritium FD-334 SS-4]|uniref:Uncharacterized protein n=1 Tax=Hypholoma sublateritium (strain FD-334 SS-4) TaxID=945553 RepID=A0A0D2NW25_HYPSF|nr:hypothetical protein HYPSUDRAFT_81192 [Hypholoma sublateritium FD-334 SS-4]
MLETPAFATEFAKIALLTNVGRINTTMAFFPEMKTALRTYHPVPSLQKTDGNAQDAPRIKNCLKAVVLPAEAKSAPPSAPDEVLAKLRTGARPPTLTHHGTSRKLPSVIVYRLQLCDGSLEVGDGLPQQPGSFGDTKNRQPFPVLLLQALAIDQVREH